MNLLNLIDYEKYAVDLLLFKREGLFLSQIPKEVRLLQPTDSLQYAYKIDRGMFSSVSGVKAGILRGQVHLYVNVFTRKMQDNRDG